MKMGKMRRTRRRREDEEEEEEDSSGEEDGISGSLENLAELPEEIHCSFKMPILWEE